MKTKKIAIRPRCSTGDGRFLTRIHVPSPADLHSQACTHVSLPVQRVRSLVRAHLSRRADSTP